MTSRKLTQALLAATLVGATGCATIGETVVKTDHVLLKTGDRVYSMGRESDLHREDKAGTSGLSCKALATSLVFCGCGVQRLVVTECAGNRRTTS